jgi:hypothetical protein
LIEAVKQGDLQMSCDGIVISSAKWASPFRWFNSDILDKIVKLIARWFAVPFSAKHGRAAIFFEVFGWFLSQNSFFHLKIRVFPGKIR